MEVQWTTIGASPFMNALQASGDPKLAMPGGTKSLIAICTSSALTPAGELISGFISSSK